MKALFHRFQRSVGVSKDREEKGGTGAPPAPSKEKSLDLTLGPLPTWPPQDSNSDKPLPTLQMRPLPPSDQLEVVPVVVAASDSQSSSNHSQHPDRADTATPTTATTRSNSNRRATGTSMATSEAQSKKVVAFISPATTPGPGMNPSSPPPTAFSLPPKNSVTRFQGTHGRASVTGSRTDLNGTQSRAGGSTRGVTPTSHAQKTTDGSSFRSATPYSQMSGNSSRILAVASWSEGAEEDLVSNLGPRERTRQEVLWEIVASEERYVGELHKMKEYFIDPLLHPFSTPPILSPTPISPLGDETFGAPRSDSPLGSIEALPIAARFMSPTSFRDPPVTAPSAPSTPNPRSDHPTIDGESMDEDDEGEGDDHLGQSYTGTRRGGYTSKHDHPRSPYRGAVSTKTGVAFPSRSHQSLPPPPRGNAASSSTHSLGRQSTSYERERNMSSSSATTSPKKPSTPTGGTSRVLRKFRRSQNSKDVEVLGGAVPPHQLPEDFRVCLEVIESGVLDGHVRLSEGLRKRYDEQYPLVRSLADVFVSNSDIFQGYATYVLHLERALEQVDNALSAASAAKKPKSQDAAEWFQVCKYLQRLEGAAADSGETGLAITLSKPFQRLLKYPLLFQNLLFHTDPSTFEYESTLQMVAEVESIVRSIEDEKIQKEDRDRTRDVFARIEGLDKVKQLSLPKPSRILLEERVIIGVNPQNGTTRSSPAPPPTATSPKSVKGKTSFKRLSDVLQTNTSGVGGKKDLWLVVFNDVVLRCQRTGTTTLPLVSTTAGSSSRTTSMPELNKSKQYGTSSRRNAHTKPRNMYKFVKIETWAIGDVVKPREGVVSMDDVVKSRDKHHSMQPRIIPMPDEEGKEDDAMDSDDSDRKSKMSFSYWGADKVTIQKPVIAKPRTTARRGSPLGGAAYGRESSANAKFGTRLVSGDHPAASSRPASRRTQATPSVRTRSGAPSEDTAKSTITRPAWDSTTRSAAAATSPAPIAAKQRVRNTSQTSSATRATTSTKTVQSLAPSEDSGVGLYRQMMAQDPSLN